MSNQPQAHVADERAAFEAAAMASPYACYSTELFANRADEVPRYYDDSNTEAAWLLWQAARAAIPAGANGVDDIAFNAQRLRNVAHLVGLQGAIPDSDSTLDGARGAVLGMIADRLRREMKWDSSIAAGAPAETPKPVAVVDDSDDGLFVEILPGEHGTSLKMGDFLYAAQPAPAPATDARDEFSRIKRVAECATVDSFLALPEQDKRYWFAQCLDESERRKLAESRLNFLHSNNRDADGWEWGVARVRISSDGKIEYLWGLSDHSDIDRAAMLLANSPREAG